MTRVRLLKNEAWIGVARAAGYRGHNAEFGHAMIVPASTVGELYEFEDHPGHTMPALRFDRFPTADGWACGITLPLDPERFEILLETRAGMNPVERLFADTTGG